MGTGFGVLAEGLTEALSGKERKNGIWGARSEPGKGPTQARKAVKGSHRIPTGGVGGALGEALSGWGKQQAGEEAAPSQWPPRYDVLYRLHHDSSFRKVLWARSWFTEEKMRRSITLLGLQPSSEPSPRRDRAGVRGHKALLISALAFRGFAEEEEEETREGWFQREDRQGHWVRKASLQQCAAGRPQHSSVPPALLAQGPGSP